MDIDNLSLALDRIKTLQDEMDRSNNTASEGEILSSGNKKLARLFELLGAETAQIETAAAQAGDNYDYLRHTKTLSFMERKIAVEKSKSLARTDPEVVKALETLRKWENSATMLQKKTKSLWAYLDQSRSRLSWISRDRGAA